MQQQQLWIQAVLGGAIAGVLLEVLVLRLNPEVPLQALPVALGFLLWTTWGAFVVGVTILALWALLRLFRPGSRKQRTWQVPMVIAAVYFVAAVLTRVNADMHAVFLPGSVHRMLRQDAIAWLVAGVLALGGGLAVRRYKVSRRWRWLTVVVFLLLPFARLTLEPGTLRTIPRLSPRPLERPKRPLLVIGLEGLDSRVMLTHVGVDRYPSLARFTTEGSWGPLAPYRPYLRQSLWTSTATGAFPRRHGVKSRFAWYLPIHLAAPLRLLPWTPAKSGWVLPWWLQRKEAPPSAAVPPLWERLQLSGVKTTVLGWPGLWRRSAAGAVPQAAVAEPDGLDLMEPAFRASFEAVLSRFPRRRQGIIDEIGGDMVRLAAGHQAIANGSRNTWIYLRGLAEVRRNLEPLQPRHVAERELLELTLELLDQQIGLLMKDAGPETLVAMLSPYGMAPPSSKEQLLRLIGVGGTWRTSAHTCPNGLLALVGSGVQQQSRFHQASLTDLAPTLCFLIGLPVPQYIDGRVILEAVEPAYLSDHPLRFVE